MLLTRDKEIPPDGKKDSLPGIKDEEIPSNRKKDGLPDKREIPPDRKKDGLPDMRERFLPMVGMTIRFV